MIPAGWHRGMVVCGVAAVLVCVAIPGGGAGAAGQLGSRLAALLAFALAATVFDGRPSARRVKLPLLALGGLAALGIIQSLRWPPVWVRLLSPSHDELAATTRGLLDQTGVGTALSLAPDLSRSAAFTATTTAAFLAAAFVAGARRRHRRWLALALVAAGVWQVLYGAREWLGGLTPRLRGTFVNPNHLAYALEIALAVAFAWAAWAVHRQRSAPSLERRLGLIAPPFAACLLLTAGLLATGSRAGLAAAGTGLLLQCLLLPRALRGPRRRLAFQALVVVALAVLALVAFHGVGRLAETTLYEVAWGDRALVWRQSIRLWLRFPLTGSGLGTFGEAFPLVQPAETTELYWRRAHCDPLELLITGGVVGAALGIALALGVGRSLARVLRRGVRTEDRLAALAAAGAVAAVAVHELADFGLTLPGIALPVVAVIGAAAAARLTPGSRSAEPGRAGSAGAREGRARADERPSA